MTVIEYTSRLDRLVDRYPNSDIFPHPLWFKENGSIRIRRHKSQPLDIYERGIYLTNLFCLERHTEEQYWAEVDKSVAEEQYQQELAAAIQWKKDLLKTQRGEIRRKRNEALLNEYRAYKNAQSLQHDGKEVT